MPLTTQPLAPTAGTAQRWVMLAASTLAQGAAAVMIHGPAFLIPTLHARHGLSLTAAGVVAAASTVGVMAALVAWGALADHRGERVTLLAGLSGATVFGGLAAVSDDVVLLTLALVAAGACAASTPAAGGRLVVGWFPPGRRGLAMGIRQMAQPAGVGLAAIGIAVLAAQTTAYTALWLPTAVCAVAALVVALVVADPPPPHRADPGTTANPYRQDDFLHRIHGVSVLLVVPQFVVWTFALVWLIDDRGWQPAAAGALVAVAQVGGALGRIAVGQLSDIVASRLRPLRWVSVTAAAVMLLLGLTTGLDHPVAVALMVAATVVTVADNGLAFTAVAERAGPFWSGRALGVQNTSQYLAASAVPPVMGFAVTHAGYAVTFGLVSLFPLAAVGLVPVRFERELS